MCQYQLNRCLRQQGKQLVLKMILLLNLLIVSGLKCFYDAQIL
jgi:hypothetical protein